MYSHETKDFVKIKVWSSLLSWNEIKLWRVFCLSWNLILLIYCLKSGTKGTKAILIIYRRKDLAGAWIYKLRKLSWQKCNGILNKRTKETVQYKRFGIKCIVVKGYIVELNKWDRESITALHFLYVFSQRSVINAYPYSVITIWA